MVDILLKDKYLKEVEKTCKQYALQRYMNTDDAIKAEDVAQEMLKLMWQSYCNCNGLSKVIREQKLIPQWQLHLLFLNALRNLNLLNNNTDSDIHHLNPARVLIDENGEIIDFYYPYTPEQEEAEERKSKLPQGRARERWLERIRRLKELGYSDQEIVEMLKPVKQEVLF